MPKIKLANSTKIIEVSEGELLMPALLKAGIPVASSCQGDGICGKCKIQIIEGEQNISPPNDTEKILVGRLRIPRPYRISCQTQVLGDITVFTTYW
ncbi:MAG: (2Fe-2S)-binding protein [Bdellovibrionales bacterium]|nr:(2Fe-2S)-binding protein [Bdellovibrionales bacterium]